MRPAARRTILLIGTALGVAFIGLLFVRYNPRAVLLPILDSKPHILLAVTALIAGVQFLNAATPVTLLGPSQREAITPWEEVRVFLATQPLSLIAPGRLSDFGVLPLLKKHHPPGALASAIVLDRLITILFLLLLAPPALHFVWPNKSSLSLNLAILASLAMVATVPFLLLNQRVRRLVNRTLLRFSPGLLEGFGAHTHLLLHTSRTRLLANLGLTALKTLLSAAIIALLASNVGVSLGLATATWMSVLIQLATSIPISIQGIGIAEGSLVLLFSVNGLGEALALSMGVTARILFLPVYLVIYLATTVRLLSERMGEVNDSSDAAASEAESARQV